MLKFKKKLQLNPITTIIFVVLFVYSVLLVGMVIWGFFNSLKSTHDFMYGDPFSLLPIKGIKEWAWYNYVIVYNNFVIRASNGLIYDMWALLGNSIMYSVVCSIISSFVPFVVSYITTKYNFFYCNIINTMVIILIGLPIVGGNAPTLRVLYEFGWFDTVFGMIFMHMNFVNTYFLIYAASWRGIPNEYRDAAAIDGASELAIFLKIMMPMMYKMYLTVVLIQFVGLWNDYSWVLIYMPSMPVLAYAVQNISLASIPVTLPSGIQDNINSSPYRLAASMILLMPILILFIIFHNRLMGNLSMGGLKE